MLPPTATRQVTVEEEAPSRTSAHNTAFQDRRGRSLPRGVDAAQARWKHHSDPLNVNQGKPNYRHVSTGPSKKFFDREKYNSIFDASKQHFHYVKGVKHYVIHGDELSSHMENIQRVSGLTNVVSFSNDIEYKLAHKGAFFYPFTFHMRMEYPVEQWTVEFARALVSFPEIDTRLIVYRTDGKKDLNKVRTAEKLVEVLGMSEPVALAATCAICCASRDLSRLLRHDVVREELDESVPVEKIVQNFFYGPVMGALAVKTSGASRFRAYIRYKDEEKGTWVKQLGPTSRDAREIDKLKLMATGGWSEKIKGNKRTSVDSAQSLQTTLCQVAEILAVSWCRQRTKTQDLCQDVPGRTSLCVQKSTIHLLESTLCTRPTSIVWSLSSRPALFLAVSNMREPSTCSLSSQLRGLRTDGLPSSLLQSTTLKMSS